MGRRDLALRPPDPTLDFARFPRKTLRAGTTWFRQHRARTGPDHGAWFYASHAAGAEGAGRFDLAQPDGTCYLASTEAGAVNELVGPECAVRGWVDADLLTGRVVSRLRLPDDVRAADTTSPRSSTYRLTNELPTTERYDLTQRWAQVFHVSGAAGVYALLRFTPGSARSLALFGPAGAPDPPPPGDIDPVSVRAVLERRGVEVIEPPAAREVRIVGP